MNKRVVLGIIIGSIIGIGILGSLYFFLFNKKDDATNPVVDVFRSFFPGGGGEDPQPDPDLPFFDPSNPLTAPEIVLPKLRLISGDWVSGFITYDRASTTNATSSSATSSKVTIVETAIRFVSREKGHVLETTERDFLSTKLSITTIPRIEEAHFATKDSLALRRFNGETDEIETFVGSLVPVTPTSTDSFDLKGAFLAPNISQITLFGNKMFSLYSRASGASGYVTTPIGGKEVSVFTSPLSGWLPEYVADNFITLTSKPTAKYGGNLFVFNTTNKSLLKLLGPTLGLTAKVSRDLDKIIYTESVSGGFNTFYKNTKENTIMGLQSKTLPEKCVWPKDTSVIYCAVPEIVPRGEYPDDWYKGLISFTDKLVKIDLNTNTETTLLSLQLESDRAIDAVNLKLDDRERFIYFINKIDGSFWSYDLR